MGIPASPSLSIAFLTGTAFGDLLAGRFLENCNETNLIGQYL